MGRALFACFYLVWLVTGIHYTGIINRDSFSLVLLQDALIFHAFSPIWGAAEKVMKMQEISHD